MLYFVRTDYYDRRGLVTSGGKGRDDYFEMLKRCGLKCIQILPQKACDRISVIDRLRLEFRLTQEWRKALSRTETGDVLFIHNPPSEKFLGLVHVIRSTRRRGCKIVTIIFDLETYLKPYFGRAGGIRYLISLLSERSILRCSDHVLVHNDRMKDVVAAMGYDPDRITSVGMMDYLSPNKPDLDSIVRGTGKEKDIVFCGNLVPEKAGFLSEIPDDIKIDLYGPGYTEVKKPNLRYKGVFPSLEIMDVISGSFGLVWDGESSHTGSGAAGEYLRINNPYKMALYLASGLPVIVWSESAMADLVLNEKCGFAVSDLSEIKTIIDSLTDNEYEEMRDSAIKIAGGLREGIHIKKAIETIIQHFKNEH